jgi:sialate O-acetylesterase
MTPDFSTLDTWILAGQSNMQGAGFLSEGLPPDERVWNFSSAGKWEMAREPLHRLWASYLPAHQDLMRPFLTEEQNALSDAELDALEVGPQGTGLGLAFGQTLADALDRPIGLISASHGGTSLDHWDPAKKDEHGLYGAMLQRAKDAGAPIRGILWYQGESEAFAKLGATYAERFTDWIAAARADLGLPELPVLLVQLGNLLIKDPEWNCETDWDLVREALRQVGETVPHTAATTAVDLGLVDGIHLNAKGLIRLGRRMARQALHLTDQPQIPGGPRLERLESTTSGNNLAGVRVVCSDLTGAWQPEKIFGFSIRTAEGQPHPTLDILTVQPDPADMTMLDVRLNMPPEDPALAGATLGYGLGFDPCCNAVDAADMPLCAFLPKPMGWKR